MHEISIATNIVAACEEEGKKNNATRIRSIRLIIGSLSGVEVEAIKFCFREAANGTILQDADLKIEERQAKAICNECGKEFFPKYKIFLCPYCDSLSVSLMEGKELLIDSIEI